MRLVDLATGLLLAVPIITAVAFRAMKSPLLRIIALVAFVVAGLFVTVRVIVEGDLLIFLAPPLLGLGLILWPRRSSP